MNIKTNLWTIMRNISSTYYYLDKFERKQDDKFIENTDELSTIGHEMFDAFYNNYNNPPIDPISSNFTTICDEETGAIIGVSKDPTSIYKYFYNLHVI